MTTAFWLNDPKILLKNDQITAIWPHKSMTSNEKLNAISRLVILLTVIGIVVSHSLCILVTGVVTLGIILFLHRAKIFKGSDDLKNVKEGFGQQIASANLVSEFTAPQQNNPAMNVLLPEIKDDPKRAAAAPAFQKDINKDMNENTKSFIEKEFDDKNIGKKLFHDLGDNFNFDQSMRSFYATPNTRIPNDQKAFADFCYGDMISCKEGNALACERDNPRWTTP